MEFSWDISNSKRWCCEYAALHMPANLGDSAVARGLEMVSFHSNRKERKSKECPNYRLIEHIWPTCQELLRIPQSRLQQNVSHELPDVKAGFLKGRGPGDWIANTRWALQKARELQENIYSYLTRPKILIDTTKRHKKTVTSKRGIFFQTLECMPPDKISIQFSSIQSLSRVHLFAAPWIAARQASLSITNSRSSLRLTSIESVMPSCHLILCRPLLLLPPIPPSIRVFSNESNLRIRWPKYWSFSFSIIPSKKS